MSVYRKKVVVFLAIIAVGSSALVAVSSRSSAGNPGSANSKSKVSSSFADDPNLDCRQTSFSPGTPNIAGNSELFFKMMFSVLLVAVLGVATIYVSRRLLPRITNLPGKQMRIVETIYLGPRKTIHLLKIGNQRLLIGCTNETITKLADVADMLSQNEGDLTELSVQQADSNSRI